jgi:starvation-inducible DNA-binding protein
MDIQIGIAAETRKQIGTLLNKLVADEMTLFMKTKNFHWNVTGPHFKEYHLLFEEQAVLLQATIDDAAERVRMLGLHSVGTMEEFISLSRIKENPKQNISDRKMIEELLDNHETVIHHLRAGIEVCTKAGDEGNADFLIATLRQHEKISWMLRASLS